MNKFTKEEAIEFYNSKKWKELTAHEIAALQLNQDKLCVPFSVFHKSIEEALKRPVLTHEFALNREGLKSELAGLSEEPSLEQIIDLIPKEKLIVLL